MKTKLNSSFTAVVLLAAFTLFTTAPLAPAQSSWSNNALSFENETYLHGGFGTGPDWEHWDTDSVLWPYEWNHVAASYDGAVYRVHVNGSQIFTENIVAVPVNTPVRHIGQAAATISRA